MNSRWFYFLFANVAVLTANIWLFVDKSEPTPDSTPLATVGQVAVDTNTKNSVKGKGLSSIDGFYFMLNDPLAPQKVPLEQDLKPELTAALALISEKNAEIKNTQQKSLQQSDQIAHLEKQNNKLSRQLFILEAEFDRSEEALVMLEIELDRSEEKLAANKLMIDQFVVAEENTKSAPLKTPNKLLKKSIDSKPDLVVLTATEEGAIGSVTGQDVDEDNFSGSVEFGFNYEEDNQITKAVKGRVILDYDKQGKYNINSELDFEFESEDEITSTDKYRWQLQSDYNLDLDNLVYVRSDLSRSKFASYEREDILTVGYSRVFFNTVEHASSIELGPGYRFSAPNISGSAVSIDEFIVRTRIHYERILTESLQVHVNAVLEAGHSHSVYSFNFKAQNRIYQELYLVFDFDYKYTEKVPVDTVNKEIASGLSLLYAF